MSTTGDVDLLGEVPATHNGSQLASSSATEKENTQLCWKCQALMSSQCLEGVEYYEEDGLIIGEVKAIGRRLEATTFVETAQEGCPLCQRLLHIMGASKQDSLHRLRQKGLTYEYGLYLKEGRPGYISMTVTSQNIKEELNDNEIKCFMNLYPSSGK